MATLVRSIYSIPNPKFIFTADIEVSRSNTFRFEVVRRQILIQEQKLEGIANPHLPPPYYDITPPTYKKTSKNERKKKGFLKKIGISGKKKVIRSVPGPQPKDNTTLIIRFSPLETKLICLF